MQEQYKFNDCSLWSKYFDPTTCPDIYSDSKSQLIKRKGSDDSNYFVSRCTFAYFKTICIWIDRKPSKSTLFSHDCTFLYNNATSTICIYFNTGNYVQYRVCSMNCNSSSFGFGLSFTSICASKSNEFTIFEDSSSAGDVAPKGGSIYSPRYGMISMKSVNVSKCSTYQCVCFKFSNEENGQSSVKFCSFTNNVAEKHNVFTNTNSKHYIKRCHILNNSESGSNIYKGFFFLFL